MSIDTRVGDWLQTASGRRFYPLDPRPEDIHIEDIAGALSRICRFGGHCSEFYSVGQHSVLVSEACDPQDALWGLLHDAAEAYVGDIVRPLKRQPCMVGYCEAEWSVWGAICERFGLRGYPYNWELPESVKRADEVLLATEARDLMNVTNLGEYWAGLRGIEPLSDTLCPWTPDEAEWWFLSRFEELTACGAG